MYNDVMNYKPNIPEEMQKNMQERLDSRCAQRQDKKKQMTPVWSIGQELVQEIRQVRIFDSAPQTLVVEDTGIWYAEFFLHKQRNESMNNLWFISAFAPDVAWVHIS